MKRVLVETKVNTGAGLLAEALKPRRRCRPGELVHYSTYGEDAAGETVRQQGNDIVELMRNKEPSIFLKRLQKWLFTKEVIRLPFDSFYKKRMARYEEQGAKETA